MGCSFSRLNALYDAVNGGASVTSLANKVKDPSHLSDDGTYALKKVLIQNSEQLELVREEICVSSLFSHPNLLPLLDHAIISIKPGNVLLTHRKGQSPLGILMDFRSARPARKQICSLSKALQLQHCSTPFRAPKLWDCLSDADIDERNDIWSLGCTLYAIIIMYEPTYLDIWEGITYRIPPTYYKLSLPLNLPSFFDIRVEEFYLKGTLDLGSLATMLASDKRFGPRSRAGMGEPHPQYESLRTIL
ncbi:hypothetical protein V6N11_045157 [Hibiscus sabdariffa]|uniref:non-specific serine/threonine protein kinase n=1 Tax=Hibiscus sabdariffa TaxID=183260 RepID=A0ABR1ZS90_9ROSI